MPVARLPLAGTFNQRTIDGSMALADAQDQRYLNCVFSVSQNPVNGRPVVYVEKRPGWGVDSIVAAGSVSTGLLKTDFLGSAVSAFGATNSTIYDGQVSVGTITGRALYLSETLISGIGYVLIKSSDGTGWYYASNSKAQTAYAGDTANGSPVVTNIASTVGMHSGQLVAGTGIPVGTRILTVDSSTQITLNANATATDTAVDITKTPVAKILDADFVTTGSTVTAFVDMDGYVLYANEDGYLYNSNLNSVHLYSANDKVAAQMISDPPTAVARQKQMVVVWGHASMEAFHNAGNVSGSPFSRVPQVYSRVGAVDQRSVCSLMDDIYFVTAAEYGDVAVMRLRGMQAQPASSPWVNKILGTAAATGGYVYLSAFQLGGQPYVAAYATTATDDIELLFLETGEKVLQESGDDIVIEADPSSTASFARLLVYNAGLDVWSEWDCSLATYVVGAGAGSANQILASSRVNTGGKIYTIKPSSQGQLHTDDSSTYSMQIRLARVDHGTEKRKFVHSVRLVADEQSTGTVTLEASDDDYGSWVTLGTFDLTQKDKRINRCGSHKGGRAYRLTHSDDGAFRAEALEIEFTEGAV